VNATLADFHMSSDNSTDRVSVPGSHLNDSRRETSLLEEGANGERSVNSVNGMWKIHRHDHDCKIVRHTHLKASG
jgi:hypothetical protein